MSTIFIDRDGVINENRSDYVKSWSEFRFLPGSREAIATLTKAGHRIVVCTNQAGVAKGLISIDTVEEIHRNMLAGIQEVGGVIEKIYYCTHSADANCDCRKPRPGMLFKASRELDLDLSDAIFVGDSITDIQAGTAAGVRTMLVLTGLGMEHFRKHSQQMGPPFRVALNLKHAADVILQGTYIHDVQTSLERACYDLLNFTEPHEPLRTLQKQYALIAEAWS
ncbi:MAG TPA: D-glycero-beta-D-manno-heptose 1,7-bisphosphate 7-phosphatase [Ktedonobacteraceae bacterium]|nr:D-glycero-beta-D-manno-heptose 1,7-bisphosphate 7-phosphatase [Ktedonobacteraceae bacterium]